MQQQQLLGRDFQQQHAPPVNPQFKSSISPTFCDVLPLPGNERKKMCSDAWAVFSHEAAISRLLQGKEQARVKCFGPE